MHNPGWRFWLTRVRHGRLALPWFATRFQHPWLHVIALIWHAGANNDEFHAS